MQRTVCRLSIASRSTTLQDALIDTYSPDLARIKSLALMIVTEDNNVPLEPNIEKRALHECFNSRLLRLLPNGGKLAHLTIYSDVHWGVRPFTDLRKVKFPRLKSLILGSWTIAHDWQIDWITSHGDTLQELVLDDCPIAWILQVGEADFRDNWPDLDWSESIQEYSTRWSDVFLLFQQRLKQLKHFGFARGLGANAFDHKYTLPACIESSRRRYITYQTGTGPSPWTSEVLSEDWYEFKDLVERTMPLQEQNAKDEKALNALLRTIGRSDKEIQEMKQKKYS